MLLGGKFAENFEANRIVSVQEVLNNKYFHKRNRNNCRIGVGKQRRRSSEIRRR